MKKKTEPKKNPPRRPQIPINWDVVDKWLEADCTGTQVAGMLAVHPDTLYDRCAREKGMTFTEYSNIKRCKGDGLIKDKQFTEALKGDRAMLIWLGKQRLGQKENHEVNVTGTMNVGVINYGSEANPVPWKKEVEKKNSDKK